MSGSRRRPPGAGSGWWNVIPILFLVLLDVGFNRYFWLIPKRTGQWADFGYQFLFDTQRLHLPKPPGATRVIALGSSVSGSFDPSQVASLVEAENPSTTLDVHRLLLPGMKPSDYRLFFETERQAMQPDMAVVIVNIADFLNPSFERDLKEQVRTVLPPGRTLWERHAYMSTVSSELDLMLASVSNIYRYRKAIRSSIQDHVKFAVAALRQRTPHRADGLYPDGYTRPVFDLPLAGASELTLDYFVSPVWIEQRGRVKLDFSVQGRRLAERVERGPGWKTIRLNLPDQSGRFLRVAADSAWSPRAAGINDDARLLGVQLREQPVESAYHDGAPPRPDLSADHRQQDEFLRMGDVVGQEFVDRWWQVLSANTPFGQRMRAYQKSILNLCRHPFSARGEHAELERLIADFSEHGVPVVLINSPESPLILRQYEDTPYYRDHVGFLRSLAGKYHGVRFYDLASALPVEDFNDWHHVNYIGAIKLGPRYAHFIQQALNQLQMRQHQL
jgi:hypothetical protein